MVGFIYKIGTEESVVDFSGLICLLANDVHNVLYIASFWCLSMFSCEIMIKDDYIVVVKALKLMNV